MLVLAMPTIGTAALVGIKVEGCHHLHTLDIRACPQQELLFGSKIIRNAQLNERLKSIPEFIPKLI